MSCFVKEIVIIKTRRTKMAKITDIRKCGRLISAYNKTAMDVNFNQEYFSIWVHAAGQESGLETCPLNVQLNTEMAERLRNYLNEFLNKS
jgi:hypothetical protein